ncbi:MAG: ATP-binding cassette domain-containing protein [Geminicoccaceae bacterium]|nr:ATP-binding cassette domain-containing protein [Geminicoccaceae bacterium]
MRTPPLVEAEGLEKRFEVSRPWLARMLAREPRRYVHAVAGVDLAIPRGRTLALVGESGCGKSTVARLLVSLLRPSAGRIRFDGQTIDPRAGRRALAPFRSRIQMIFQDPYASLNPRLRVADIVAEPLDAFGLVRGRGERADRVAELLRQVGLSPADGRKFPHEFSGGQRQRISIARALASRPDFVVCDEPTSALDVSVQAQILNLMKDLQEELGLTYLFISHNLAVVSLMAEEVAVMYLGRIVEQAPAADLFARPRHPYTRLLLATVPDLDGERRERVPVAGEVPSPIDPPAGCAFHPRCPWAFARCRQERPELRRCGPTLVACHAVEEGRLDAGRARAAVSSPSAAPRAASSADPPPPAPGT